MSRGFNLSNDSMLIQSILTLWQAGKPILPFLFLLVISTILFTYACYMICC